MKKLIAIIIIIGALALLYLLNEKSRSAVKIPENNVSSEQPSRPNPANATFIFDNERVVLSNGRSVKGAEETSLLDLSAYGDLNGDKKEDIAILAARTGGGTGLFIYVTAYTSTASSYKGTNAIYLGDRIVPESIIINNGIITVRYLDRSPDEPFAAEPTVPSSKQFVIKSGELAER